ncbi:P30, predicted lipoprotein [Mycoplasmopsis bovis 8790]|nr:P30, predicted lipoprotein [Mycoplasmopsis bovis 8790]
MKHKLLLSLGAVLTATFSFPLIAAKCDGSDKKEEKKKVEEPVKPAEGTGTGDKATTGGGTTNSGNSGSNNTETTSGIGDKTTPESGTADSNGASSNSASAPKADEKETKETSDSPKKDGDKVSEEKEGTGTGDKAIPASRTANSNGASSDSTSAPKTNEKEIKESSDSPKKDGEKVSKKQKATYKDIDFDLSNVKIVINKKDIKDEDLIPPLKGDKKQVFFNTFNKVTKVSGKFNKEKQKPWEGVEIGTVTGLPDGYSIANAEKPLFKGNKPSGYVNVENEGGKLKIKFRFFKYNKGASPTVSTKVYKAIIS